MSGPMLWAGMLFSTLLVLLTAAFPGVALAADSSTLTIVLTHTHEGKTVMIEGASAEAYQVARVDDNLQNYELTEPFSSLDVDFNQDYSSEIMWLFAKQASAIVKKDGLTGTSRTSDADGALHFGALENGVYLVRETGAVGAATAYQEFDPFLISVPQIDEGQVTYDVISYPKVPLKTHGEDGELDPDPNKDPDPSKKPDEPKETDTTTTIPWIPINNTRWRWPWEPEIPVYPWRTYTNEYETPRRVDTDTAIRDLVVPPDTNTQSTTTLPGAQQPNAATPAVSVDSPASRVATTVPAAAGSSSSKLATTADDTSWIAFQVLVAAGLALTACSVVVGKRRGSRTRVGK